MDHFIGKNSSDKHIKYKDFYGKNQLYWGIGLENELYLEFDNKIQVDKKKFLNNHKRERYSVDYFKNYIEEYVDCGFLYNSFIESIELPVLLNSHSFTKTDKNNQSKTLYTKLCEPNPKFCGQTLWELAIKNPYLADNFQKNFTFDGDTIEIITQNFYNTNICSVMQEYKQSKKDFLKNLQNVFSENNIFQEHGQIGFIKDNHQFAIYLTNQNNIGIFNNGTLHFNITLPTHLDENGKIADKKEFINIHKNYIKLIQFIEPFFLAKYGSPDKFSTIKCDYAKLFSACSQRCAVSRYIGIGTYDTDDMKTGKLLQDDSSNFDVVTKEYGWYNQYYKKCAYTKGEKMGYDINFNKHYNHGVEIRFFDHITDDNKIEDVLQDLIYLGDWSLENNIIENPIKNPIWNGLIAKCMREGKNTNLNFEELELYNMIFSKIFLNQDICGLYDEIIAIVSSTIEKKFSKYVIKEEVTKPVIKILSVSNRRKIKGGGCCNIS
jgi:hypothetical protein